MRLLTAVSGVRVPQQAPKKKPAKVSFLFCYFCYYLEPPTLFSACTTPACRTDAENALFRRTECSLRGFESLNRRQKRSRMASFLFSYSCCYLEPPTLFSACTTPACRTDAENALFRRTVCSLRGFVSAGRRRKRNLLRFLFFCFIIPVIISNPLHCFRPARLPRAEQMPKTRYSVALCAPYGGSCPRAGARKETC